MRSEFRCFIRLISVVLTERITEKSNKKKVRQSPITKVCLLEGVLLTCNTCPSLQVMIPLCGSFRHFFDLQIGHRRLDMSSGLLAVRVLPVEVLLPPLICHDQLTRLIRVTVLASK